MTRCKRLLRCNRCGEPSSPCVPPWGAIILKLFVQARLDQGTQACAGSICLLGWLKGFPMVNYLFMHHLTRINRHLSDALARAGQKFVTGLTGLKYRSDRYRPDTLISSPDTPDLRLDCLLVRICEQPRDSGNFVQILRVGWSRYSGYSSRYSGFWGMFLAREHNFCVNY